jgi:hypothetical protein
MGFHEVPWNSMRFYDVLVNRSVPTEANRGLTSYNSGTMEYGEAAAQVAAKVSAGPQRSKKARGSSDQEPAQPAVRRCGNCSGTGHNARMCRKDTEISSESDVSTTYVGSLFDSNEIEDA